MRGQTVTAGSGAPTDERCRQNPAGRLPRTMESRPRVPLRPATPDVPASVPQVRVVVINYNGGDLTMACLRSLLATDWPADRLRVVLVEQASNVGSVTPVRA